MPHKHSAIKHLRQTKKRTLANVQVKKSLAYIRKAAHKALAKKDEQAALKLYATYQKEADRAARKRIIKKNTAARRKSQLATAIHSLKSTKK